VSQAAPAHLPPRRGDPAWDIALLFPAQGEWSEEEYLALDTNHLVEFSDGFIEVLPMPNILHQLLVKYLHGRLEAFVQSRALGLALFAPLSVRLWPGKFREPDLIYLRPGRVKDRRGQPEGADLVMEIVSEGDENRERDLVIKRAEYAKAGIAEYWIVDPETRRVVVLTLEGDIYREHGSFCPGQHATSPLLQGFEIDVDELLKADEAV
jgi:Uma2 family endonuclease